MLQAFFTHFRMWVPTATRVPSWLVILMSRGRAPPLLVDGGDRVVDGDGIAKVHRCEEADAVVTERHGRLVRAFARMGDRKRRGGRHVAHQQRAMGLKPAVAGLLHVALVDMVGREIAGDAGEQIDVRLADRLGESGAVADLHIEVAQRDPSPARRGSPHRPRPSLAPENRRGPYKTDSSFHKRARCDGEMT